MRFGTVALFGRSNVGKSTFLNAVLEQDLAIVSRLPQTTRDALLGLVTREDAQIAFLDTPGIHRPKSELGRRMNHAAKEALRSAEAVLWMTDVEVLLSGKRKPAEDPIHPDDRALLGELPAKSPTVLALNKVDMIRDKSRLLPLLEGYAKLRDFQAIIPISARNADGVTEVLDQLIALLPEGPPGYPPDTLTDRPTSYFVREYVREQVLAITEGEVPHAAAVSIDRYEEAKIPRIFATIHVEKAGQQRILIGHGGTKIRDIGSAARARIEALLGQQVYLELFVRVSPRWKNAPRQLAELGYSEGSAKDETNKDRG